MRLVTGLEPATHSLGSNHFLRQPHDIKTDAVHCIIECGNKRGAGLTSQRSIRLLRHALKYAQEQTEAAFHLAMKPLPTPWTNSLCSDFQHIAIYHAKKNAVIASAAGKCQIYCAHEVAGCLHWPSGKGPAVRSSRAFFASGGDGGTRTHTAHRQKIYSPPGLAVSPASPKLGPLGATRTPRFRPLMPLPLPVRLRGEMVRREGLEPPEHAV